MDDLTAFLGTRLDEDEATARDSYYEGQRWLTEEEGVYRWPDDELVHSADRKADARHIARHDPARVLREVEAKRAVVAEHPGREDSIWCRTCDPAREGMDDSASYFPCRTLRIIAAVYSDHPDYRPEWKP